MKAFKDIFYKNIKSSISSLEDSETGKLTGLNISFSPINEDKIYHKSTGEIVTQLPKDIGINLDMKTLVHFNSLLLETISSYLFNIRSKILKTDLIEIINPRGFDNKYKIKVRVSRFFFREEEKGRFKISIAFLDKETNEEAVNINLSKRDIQIMSALIKKITTSYHRESGVFVPSEYISLEDGNIVEQNNVLIAKIDNSILIDNIWLHGQEIMNTLFTVQELINKLHIEKNLMSLQSMYRQIKFVVENEILYLELEKMTSEHDKEDIIKDGEVVKLRLPFTGLLLSSLHLFLDIEILRHADFEDEYDSDIEIIGKTDVFEGEKVKYHLSMKESIISVGVKERRNNPEEKRIMLFGRVKDGAFEEEDENGSVLPNYIKKYNSDGEKELVPVITEFKINLKDQWVKLVRGLSMAYTQEYIEDRSRNVIKFFVINQGPDGRFKYQFQILADPENKATSVLIIDKYKLKNKEETLEGRYRQPLFKKYVFQLIAIVLASAREIDEIQLSEDRNTIDLLRYNYKSFKTVKELKKTKVADYGIRRTDDSIEFGNFNLDNMFTELPVQDVEIINIVSQFRIFNGYWLPFVGERIAIGQDGYLTDMFSEVNLEENYGTDWATNLYFGTTIK